MENHHSDVALNKNSDLRLSDFPMYFFAAIQAQNYENVSRALAPLGISPPEWRILALVKESSERTIGELAELAVVERSSASRGVTRLVSAGLLARIDDRSDRRRGRIQLTEEGVKCHAHAQKIMKIIYRENLKGLSTKDFDTLMRCLRTIRDNTRRTETFWLMEAGFPEVG